MRWAADTTLIRSGPRCLLVNEPRRLSRLLTGEEASLLRHLVHGIDPPPGAREPLAALIGELAAAGFLEAEEPAWRT